MLCWFDAMDDREACREWKSKDRGGKISVNPLVAGCDTGPISDSLHDGVSLTIESSRISIQRLHPSYITKATI